MEKPFDPYCNRTPSQIAEYIEMAEFENCTPDEAVIENEGTYNRENGHFACTQCYIKIGMPANPYPQRNWVAP